MCKGIKDLFLVLYRNLIHHLHPLWVISECFGDKELAVFLVFAVVLVVVDFGNEVFLDTANGFALESEALHAPSDLDGIVLASAEAFEAELAHDVAG